MVEEGTDGGGARVVFGEMRSYTIIWAGQVVSLIGSNMTIFAILVWLYQDTGQATSVSLLFLAVFGPEVALSPVAGVVVDRYDRKTILLISDGMVAVSTLGILLIHQAGMLTQWSVYGLLAVGGTFHAFQFPALTAATTLLVPKRHYGRASGMLSTAWALSDMIAPIMAAFLLSAIHLTGILVIDLLTFGAALVALLAVHVPRPKALGEGEDGKASWKEDLLYGWRYILARRGLLYLLLFFFLGNLMATMGWVLLQPMILARTANDTVLLGTVLLVGGLGGILGGVVMSVWGGPKRRVRGIVYGMLVGCGIGTLIIGLDGGAVFWAAGLFLWWLSDAPTMGSSQSIWQSKVPPDRQGRVFSVRFFIALVGSLPAMLLAGPLADNVFEPLMENASGPLEWLFGSGPGAGMGLIIFICGAVMVVVSLVARGSKQLWDIEDILPDHEEDPDGERETSDGNDERGKGDTSEESPEEGAGEADEARGPPEEGPDEP
jgi:MFS family permease